MMLLFGLAAAAANRPWLRAALKVLVAVPEMPWAGPPRNCGVAARSGRLLTRIVPAPAPATAFTRPATSPAAPVAAPFRNPSGSAGGVVAMVWMAWKMLLAPPRMLTRSPEPNVPPPAR